MRRRGETIHGMVTQRTNGGGKTRERNIGHRVSFTMKPISRQVGVRFGNDTNPCSHPMPAQAITRRWNELRIAEAWPRDERY